MTSGVPTLDEPAGAVRMAWGLVLAIGIATFGCGLVLALWPESTLRILAVLVSVQLLLTGVASIVAALAAGGVDSGVRALVVLSGILSLLVGLVLLRAPQQTVVFVALLLGLWWVIKGLVELVASFSRDQFAGGRWWSVATALFTTAVGTLLVLYPQASFALLVVVVQVWLLGYGFITIVAALSMRAAARRHAGP